MEMHSIRRQEEMELDLHSVLVTAVPMAFTAGGVYAIMRWRVDKVEKAVEKMADTCTKTRSICHIDIGERLKRIEEEFRSELTRGANDRKELRDKLVDLTISMARIEEHILLAINGSVDHKKDRG